MLGTKSFHQGRTLTEIPCDFRFFLKNFDDLLTFFEKKIAPIFGSEKTCFSKLTRTLTHHSPSYRQGSPLGTFRGYNKQDKTNGCFQKTFLASGNLATKNRIFLSRNYHSLEKFFENMRWSYPACCSPGMSLRGSPVDMRANGELMFDLASKNMLFRTRKSQGFVNSKKMNKSSKK